VEFAFSNNNTFDFSSVPGSTMILHVNFYVSVTTCVFHIVLKYPSYVVPRSMRPEFTSKRDTKFFAFFFRFARGNPCFLQRDIQSFIRPLSEPTFTFVSFFFESTKNLFVNESL
jgi:hypothetical protein